MWNSLARGKNALRGGNAVFLKVKTGGIYSYRWVLRGYEFRKELKQRDYLDVKDIQ